MWNYDTAFSWAGYSRGNPISSYTPRLSGRKFYWQHNEFRWESIVAQEQWDDKGCPVHRSSLNNTIRPIKPCHAMAGKENPEYSFKFNVFFERVTKDELDKLIAVLRLGGTGYHSIGHGKPFGMGSAKIEVDNVKVRSLTAENGGIVRSLDKYEGLKACMSATLTDVFGTAHYVRQTVAMCASHNFSPILIDYPRPEKEDESYKWFVNNRGRNNTPKIRDVLPELPDNTDKLKDAVLANAVSLEKN